MVRSKSEWAIRASEALRAWCLANGYRPLVNLARELGISPRSWEEIGSARSINQDTEIYAKLYRRTGLPDVDPRGVPIMKRGKASPVVRAWTDRQWQDWLETPEARAIKTAKVSEKAKVSEPAVQVSPVEAQVSQTVGGMMDAWVKALSWQLAQNLNIDLEPRIREAILVALPEVVDKVVERLQQNSPGPKVRGSTPSAGQLAKTLRSVLLSGGPKDRDEIFRKFGEALRDLLPVLDSSTRSDSTQREAELQMIGKFG